MTQEIRPVAGTETSDILTRSGAPSIAYRQRQGRPDLPGVVFLGGFRSDMTGTKAAALDRFCAVRGQPFLRFDYTGHGGSAGRFEEGTIGSWLDDALGVLDRLTHGPQILVGSSMGGWLALLAALARRERVTGLVIVAGATDFTEALMWQPMDPATRRTLIQDGVVRIPSEYDPLGYPITRALIEEGRNHLLLDRPIVLDQPMRLLHGMADVEVPWSHSFRLINAATSSDVRLTLVKDGDHRLSNPEGIELLLGAVEELSRREAVRADLLDKSDRETARRTPS